TVTSVSGGTPLPLQNTSSNVRWGPEEALANPSLFQQADFRIVEPNYFDVMRTRIIEGRTFTAADNAPNLKHAIIDDVFARKAFPGQKAVGKRFLARTGGPDPTWYEVIGVVQHQRNVSPAFDSRETMYLTDGEVGFGAVNQWVIRTTGDLDRIAQAARSVVRQLDPSLIVVDLQPMTVLIDRAMGPTRFAMVCIGVFAVIAGILAAVGLYGVLATAVRQRTAEIGVRMAFGATPTNVFGLVVKQGLALSAIGIVVGLASAFALTRAMRTMVVGVGTTDPTTYIAMSVVFLVIAAFACWIPARRAALLDPLEALREE
ncbi:MAG: FtsX-like permease family protein, partial [Gemmatimonadaceae bacterium]